MKSLIIAVLLFAIFTVCVIINSFYILKSCSEISSYADGIIALKYTPDDIERFWQNHRPFFGLSVSEAKIERMDELIISLFTARDQQNTYESERICRLIVALAEDISANERISFQGLF